MTLKEDYDEWMNYSVREKVFKYKEPEATLQEWLDAGILDQQLFNLNQKYGFFNDFEKYKISQVYAKLVHRQSLESQGFKEGGGREYKVYFDTRHNREVAFNSKEFIDLIEDDLYKEKEAKKQGKEYVLTYAKDLIPVSTVPNSDLSFRERQSYPSISQVVDELNKENTKLKQENINLKKQLEPDPTTGKTGFDLLEERDELRKEVNKLQIRQEKWQEINKLNHALREENRVLREETIKEAVSRGLKQAKDDIERAWKDKKDLIYEKVRLQVINGLIKRKVAGETLPIYDDNILKSLEERQGDVLDDKGKVKEFGGWTKIIEWQVNRELGEPFSKWDPFKVISTEERTLEDWRFGYNIGGKDTPFYMYPYRINADQYNNLVGKIGKFSSEKFTYDRLMYILKLDRDQWLLLDKMEKVLKNDVFNFVTKDTPINNWDEYWENTREEIKKIHNWKLWLHNNFYKWLYDGKVFNIWPRRPEVEESYKRHSEVSKELKKLLIVNR